MNCYNFFPFDPFVVVHIIFVLLCNCFSFDFDLFCCPERFFSRKSKKRSGSLGLLAKDLEDKLDNPDKPSPLGDDKSDSSDEANDEGKI